MDVCLVDKCYRNLVSMCIENKKYYINGEGITNNSIWKEAFTFALSLIMNDNSIERIVFYFSAKEKIEVWFDKEKDKNLINRLWEGMQDAERNSVTYCAKTERTYKKDDVYNDIIISLGCGSSILKDLDKHEMVRYIIAVPWQLCLIDEWIKENNVPMIEFENIK